MALYAAFMAVFRDTGEAFADKADLRVCEHPTRAPAHGAAQSTTR
jgi:hypothetical protein